MDEAIARIESLYDFLRQKVDESYTLDETVIKLISLVE